MSTEGTPLIHYVRDESQVDGARAAAVRTIVLPTSAAAVVMLFLAAGAMRSEAPVLPPVPAPVVAETNTAQLLALQAGQPIAIGDEFDIEADLGAIRRMLVREGAVGIVARVKQGEDGQLQVQPLMEYDADRATHPASTIKMLVASAVWSLVVPLAEQANMTPMEYMQSRMMTTEADDVAPDRTSRFTLRTGDQISLLGAYYAMAGLSANDATEVMLNFIEQETGIAGMQYINDYAKTLGMEHTTVTVASGLYQQDVGGNGAENTTDAHDMARLGAHIAFNQAELADLFNQPYYTVVTSGRVPDDDQITAQQLENGDYAVTMRTSVRAQRADSPVGRRLSDTARNALDFAKTGFTADGDINGGRILGAFHGPDGGLYVVYFGEIGNNGGPAARPLEGMKRFEAVNLALGRTVEALWQGYDAAPERPVDQLPAALAVMLPDDTFCVGRAHVEGTDIQRCPRGQQQLARN